MTYGGPVIWIRVSKSCSSGCMAEVKGSNKVRVYHNTPASYIPTHDRLIIHEYGHLFNNAADKNAQSGLAGLLRDNGQHTDKYGHWYGFAGGWEKWQFGWTNEPGEVFADMFLGWFYNTWDFAHPEGLGFQRQDHMNKKIPDIIKFILQH